MKHVNYQNKCKWIKLKTSWLALLKSHVCTNYNYRKYVMVIKEHKKNIG